MNKTDWRELATHIIIVLGINGGFVLLVAPVYWLLGAPEMVEHLARGYAVLWGVVFIAFALSQFIERVFHLNLYDHFTPYVLMNEIASALPLLSWSAYVALRTHQFVMGSNTGVIIALFVLGFLACYIAHAVVTTFFGGQIYALLNAVVALVSYLVFAFWPTAARALFGWLIGA